ncbi:unnamed protein product [Echinostoma caproni]|uniref:HTH La-type RNA-binding domain-containing protein n=1 Tax=Echinostoma caproni TaxID=27848 RepID=A0A183AFR4_9TREM|nr:unnamed protein product [Echinostoma caproni]
MAHDRAQSLLLHQPGFIPTQPGLAAVPAVTRGFRDSTNNFAYPKLSPLILPPGAYYDQRQSTGPPGLAVRPAPNSAGSEAPPEHDHQIITYDDLEKLLPNPKPTGRVEVGVLPDGSAYAPKTGENYLLFPSKSSYILYFTHHYFSRENLSRDVPLLSRMINQMTLPLDKLIKAPRLVALNTTPEEVEQALIKSKVVCIEDLGNGVRGVRRIDGFPAIGSPNDPSSTRVTAPGSEAMTSTITGTGNGPSHQFQPPLTSAQSADTSSEDDRLLAASLAEMSFTTKTNTLPGYSFPSMEQSTGQTNVLISPNPASGIIGPGGSRLSPSQPVSCSAAHPPHPVAVAQTSATYESTTPSSNGSLSSSRPTSAIWPQPSTFALSPNNRSSLLGNNASQPLDSPSVANNNHSTSILGFPSRPPYGPGMPTGSLQTPDLQPISVLPMRHQAGLPQYLLSQPTHGSGAYPGSLSFCQMCYSKSPMNMAMAAAIGNPAHQHLSQAHLTPNPQFPGQIFHGQPGQMPSLNAHQANVALAAASSYHAAVAALAAAAQQQVSPAYFNPSITPNMHSQVQHVQQASPLPVYYAAQPLSLPTHFQRHPLPRFPHGSVYPIQSYQQPNPNAALHNPVPQSSEISGTLPKEGSMYSMNNASQVATSIAYPFLFQPHVHLPHANQPSTNNPNLVAAAAAGLHIQYSQQMTPRQPPMNAYNLAPLGLTVVNNPVSAPVQTQNTNEDTNSASLGYQEKNHPELTTDVQSENLTPPAYSTSPPVQGNGAVPASPVPASPISGEKTSDLNTKQLVDSEEIAQKTRVAQTDLTVDKADSPEDSEDSGSSGIGEMNSAGSSGPIDTRTSSSLTLTDQPPSDVTSTCELINYRRHPRSTRTKDVERSP